MYDVVILAGGRLERDFQPHYHVETKAFIPLHGKPMVEYMLDALRDVPSLGKRVLVTSASSLPQGVSDKIDGTAPGGASIVESLRSGLHALEPATDRVLILPCDAPLITAEAILDFLNSCEKCGASFCYSYVSKKNSEQRYPGLRHTYARLKEGVFCGGSMVLISPALVDLWEALFRALTAARKNPFAMAGILGWKVIARFIVFQLSIRDIEERISQLLTRPARGIQSSFAEVALNADEMSVLRRVEEILQKTGKNHTGSKGF
jgi:molybdopterin-guanine dinucleotide biosynthesis protein A